MRTLDDFRETILAKLSCRQRNDPVCIAHLFVRYFRISVRPGFEELIKVLEEAGIASVLGQKLPGGLRGTHSSLDQRHYSIRYSTDQWEGGKNHTVLHETYEIIHEMLSDQEMEPSPSRKLCWDADLFAASALMQPAVFAPFAKASGLDIIALRSQFDCSYASVTLRLAEVMRHQPLLGVLYQRKEQGNPTEWTEPPDRRQFRAVVVSWTPGFGIRDPRVLCGSRGGMPRKDTTPSPGSIAEWVVLTGKAGYAEVEPMRLGTRMSGIAIAARPITWQGHLAKVAVVAVPYEHRRVLVPQTNNGVAFERLS